jgi:hypothetical protein
MTIGGSVVSPALLPLLCAGLLACGADAADAQPGGSYLCQPVYELDDQFRGPTEPYVPQPGDIMLSTDANPIWKVLFMCAWTDHPHHSAIVVKRADGRTAILESGPHDTLHVELLDPVSHLKSYHDKGQVWIRKRRHPLTPEQCERLTAFAERANHKRFAMFRLAGQLTCLRCRGPLRTEYMGGPHGERDSYFCCELLMEACVAGGLVDPKTARPSATYPRDVFFDQSLNRWVNQHLNLSADWHPPSRWIDRPISRPRLGEPIPVN